MPLLGDVEESGNEGEGEDRSGMGAGEEAGAHGLSRGLAIHDLDFYQGRQR
jgi:hypothetical protein